MYRFEFSFFVFCIFFKLYENSFSLLTGKENVLRNIITTTITIFTLNACALLCMLFIYLVWYLLDYVEMFLFELKCEWFCGWGFCMQAILTIEFWVYTIKEIRESRRNEEANEWNIKVPEKKCQENYWNVSLVVETLVELRPMTFSRNYVKWPPSGFFLILQYKLKRIRISDKKKRYLNITYEKLPFENSVVLLTSEWLHLLSNQPLCRLCHRTTSSRRISLWTLLSFEPE